MSYRLSRTPLAAATLALLLSTPLHSASPVITGLIAFPRVTVQNRGGVLLEQAILTYQDQHYDVLFHGLGLGGAIGTTVTVTGEVYDLSSLSDLEGPFVTELADAPPKVVSADDLWLYSERGVSLRLHTDNPAATMASGSDIVLVEFGVTE